MAGILVISDLPSPADPELNFKDSYGRYVWHLIYCARLPVHDLAIEFLYRSWREQSQGSHRLREILAKHKDAKVVIALGSEVTKVFGIEGKVNKIRGSVFKYKAIQVIPTFHPTEMKKPARMFSESALNKGVYAIGDMQKAKRVYNGKYVRPVEKFIVEPTIEQVREFHELVKTNKPLLGCDLEGTGLSIEHSKITMHGFAWDEENAIVIPELRDNYKPYWSREEWLEVKEILNDIYSTADLMFQNGVGYDVPLLRQLGWNLPLERFKVDTMVMHHTLSPELEHNIGFISSVYGKQPFWKNEFITYSAVESYADMQQVYLYNARDCVALHQIYNGMQEEMEELLEDEIFAKLPEIFEKSMKLSRISIDSFEHGIQQDPKKMKEWQQFVLSSLKEMQDSFYEDYSLPPSFSLSNTNHKLRLVYGTLPDALSDEKVEGQLRLYDAKAFNYQYECTECGRKVTKKFYDFEEAPKNVRAKCPKCKEIRKCSRTEKERTSVKGKSKDTKVYRELTEKLAIKQIEPLYKLHRYQPLQTASNQDALDKSAIARYIVFIDERLATIDNMKRRLAKHEVEQEKLRGTRTALVRLQELTKFEKLRTSFVNIPTWQDGRVRPNALVTGTATGRWSYKNPPAQTMPHGKIGTKIRATFRASKDCQLISVD